MSNYSESADDKAFQARIIEAAIRISLLALLVIWCCCWQSSSYRRF